MSNPKPCSLVSRQTRGHLIECLVEWLHRNLLVPGEGIIHGECEQQRQRDECGKRRRHKRLRPAIGRAEKGRIIKVMIPPTMRTNHIRMGTEPSALSSSPLLSAITVSNLRRSDRVRDPLDFS